MILTQFDWQWFGLAGGLAIGVLGIVVGMYYGRRSRKDKRPVYFGTALNLIEEVSTRVDGLQVS